MIENRKKSAAGFTLVELIVVIAILGILAGISVPVYSGYIEKANEAADLQLLGALNTAYAAACAEMNVDPTGVIGTAALSGDTGSRIVTGISASGVDAATNAGLNEAFMRYYGENASKPFKVYTNLGYDPEQGIFVGDGGTYFYTVTLNGKQVTVAVDAASYEAILNSAFGDSDIMTMEDLMNMVAGTTSVVANYQIDYTDPENVLARAIANDDYAYFLLKTSGALDGMSESDAKLLAGYYAIFSNPAYADASGALNENGSAAVIDFMLKNNIDISDEGAAIAALTDLQESYSTASEKVSAFESSAGKGREGVNYNENMLVLYAAQQTANGFDVDSALNIIKKNSGNGTAGIAAIMKEGVDTSSISTISIPGSNFANAALGYSLATAYGERNNLLGGSVDARSVMGTQGFVDYLNSDQCMDDINGYLSCMNLLTENIESGNIDSAYVAQNGFNSSDIITALSAIFDQN